jgi:hypothetical protein
MLVAFFFDHEASQWFLGVEDLLIEEGLINL